MADARCNKCGTAIVPGSLFCWNHSEDPPKVGEYGDDFGQLLWKADRKYSSAGAEQAVAVFVDDKPVDLVAVIEENVQADPAHLRIQYTPRSGDRNQPAHAQIGLVDLFCAITRGSEKVDAKRE